MTTQGLDTDFAGKRGPLFRLALRTGVLTVLTLGIYRFWMKTRLRRYYWSSVCPGGHPLEYLGEPVEKLFGFLVAVVIMAFYIGIVNLVLMFFSFAVLHGNFAAYVLSFLGVLPIWFFATYRARRYVLARTRWRGLRFGLDPGAWGYAWRSLVHWAITLVSAGLLWPRMTFALEKYRTDRTWLGTWQLRQGGDWRMLYPSFVPLLVTGLLAAAGVAGIVLEVRPLVFALVPAGLAAVPALLAYRVGALRLLTNAKTAGPLGFEARPRLGRVIRIHLLGYGLVLICTGALLVATLFAVGLAAGALGATAAGRNVPDIPIWGATALGIALYFAVFLLWGALRHVFVTQPLWRHYAETLVITGAADLSGLRQRARDEFREAEGFAEALDLGAAI